MNDSGKVSASTNRLRDIGRVDRAGYRVAHADQGEALTNALRHARADRIELRLSYESGGTGLTASDHAATPADPEAADAAGAGGYGLTGMRERAELLGGRLDAGPTRDGFQVELWIPA